MEKNEDGFNKLNNSERWLAKYNALCELVATYGHLTDRHTQLNHWWKYQKRKRKEGKLTKELERLLDELVSLRTHEHTGGGGKWLKVNGLWTGLKIKFCQTNILHDQNNDRMFKILAHAR